MISPSTRLKSVAALLSGLLLIAACNFGEPTVSSGGGTGVEGIAGQLVGPGGMSVSGATVKVYPILYSGLGKPGAIRFPVADSVTVGANGTFSFPDLAPGTYNLLATIKRGDSTLALLVTGIIIKDKGTDLGTDTLKLTGKITLNVASNGAPLADANCYVPYTPIAAVSDSTGKCTITEVPAGTFEITVTHEGFQVGLSGDISVLPGLLVAGGVVDLVSTVAGPPAPSLVMPIDGTTLGATDNDFVWMIASGATAYHLQVTTGTDTNFAAPLLNLTDLLEPSAPVTLKEAGQTYRWRVRSRAGLSFGPWSPSRTYSMSDGAPVASHFTVTPATLALWTFNDKDSLNRYVDASGNNRHLSVPAEASLSASPHGNAISFNGARITVQNAAALSLEGNDTITYEARIWLDAYPSASLWNGGTTLIGQYAGLKLLINKAGRIQAGSQSGDGANWFWFPPVSDTGAVPLGRWVNVAVAAVRNGSLLFAYVDNVPVGLYLDIAGGATLRPTSTVEFPFTIGNDGQDNQPFPGRVEEIRVSRGLPLGPGVHIRGQPPGCSTAPVICDP